MPDATVAGIYCRISDDRAGVGLGVARQEQDCRELCRRKGWTVHQVYVDNDLSAYSGKKRPAYLRLLEDVKAHTVQVIVAWHPDRLHRSTRELEDFIDIVEESAATVETVQAGTYDLSTAAGRMVARIVGASARYESETKSARAKRKARELAEAGKVGGGSHPFGYTRDRQIIPDQAELIREAAARVLNGETVRAVCLDWHRRGVESATGARWSQTVLRRMLTAWLVCGIREHKGEPVAVGTWPPILDRPTVERLRALLLDPSRRTNQGWRRAYPLRGLVHCADCGNVMYGRPREDGQRRYICAQGPPMHGCGRVTRASWVEDYVRDLIVEAVERGQFSRVKAQVVQADADHEALFKQLQADEAELEALAMARFVDKTITAAQFNAANTSLQRRVETTRQRLWQFDGHRVLAAVEGGSAALAAKWDEGDAAYRAVLAGAVIARIDVGPAVRGRNRFDPSRFAVTWRI